MRHAQIAFSALTALFLVCGTVILATASETNVGIALVVVASIGWLLLLFMILSDRQVPPT